MAANLTSFDLVTDLLSTNNTINIAALTCAIVFGVLAIYGCFLTWRHQRWERQLDVEEGRSHRRAVHRETGRPIHSHAMQDLNPGSDDETVVEHDPDSAATVGSSDQLTPSLGAVGEDLFPGRTATEGIVTGSAEDGIDHPGNANLGVEGVPTNNTSDVNMLEDGGSRAEASVELSE